MPFWAINNKGDVVGTYVDSTNIRRGWVSFSPWADIPKSVEVPGATETFLNGINDARAVAGGCVASGKTHGFTGWLDGEGALQGVWSFDVPLSVSTVANSIDGFGGPAGFFEEDISAQTGVVGSKRRRGFMRSTALNLSGIDIARRLPKWLYSPHDVQRLQNAAALQLADRLVSHLADPLILAKLADPALQPRLRELLARLTDASRR